MIRQRVRIRFCKERELRLISHRDLVRVLERLFRRANLHLSMTEGFHPKPRLSFPAALALGIAGTDEIMDVDFATEYSADYLRAALAPLAPDGLTFKSIEVLPEGARKAQVRSSSYEFPISADERELLQQRIDALLATDSYPVERQGRREPLDIRPFIERLELTDDSIRMRLTTSRQASARPRDVLTAIGLAEARQCDNYLTRTAVEIETVEIEK
jgi:radical SAM-linked protein